MRWKASFALAAILTLLLTLSSGARAAIHITKIYFDPPGSDTPVTKKKLNNEYVIFENTGEDRSLDQWTLRDKGPDHVYKFKDFTLKAGKTVRVHTGKGKDDGNDLYLDLDFYIWNNADSDPAGDTAKLKNRDRKVIDKCAYSSGTSPKSC